MGKTLNRVPMQVHVPSSSEMKDNFLTQTNWKGLSDNKNFLTVDQETFSDCENIYVDEEGLLRSRPALKQVESFINYVEDFSDVIVYGYGVDLTFKNIKLNDTFLYSADGTYKLIRVENKIFIFTENSLNYYDIETNEVLSGDSFIYVPSTEVNENGISYKKNESPNELTNKKITTYLYTNHSYFKDISKFYGQELTVKIDDEEYSVRFNPITPLLAVGKYGTLSSNNYNNSSILGDGMEGVPYVEAVRREDGGLTSIKYEFYNDTISVYFTVSGKSYTKLPELEGAITKPYLTDDGKYVIVFTEYGPQILSIINDETSPYFTNWTNLLSYLHPSDYFPGVKYYHNNYPNIGAHFITYDTFAISTRSLKNVTVQVNKNLTLSTQHYNLEDLVDDTPFTTALPVVLYDKDNDLVFARYAVELDDDSLTSTIDLLTDFEDGNNNRIFSNGQVGIQSDSNNLYPLRIFYRFVNRELIMVGHQIGERTVVKYRTVFDVNNTIKEEKVWNDIFVREPNDNVIVKCSKDTSVIYISTSVEDIVYKYGTDGNEYISLKSIQHGYPILVETDSIFVAGRDSTDYTYLTGNYDKLEFDIPTDGENNYILPSFVTKLYSYYISSGNTLYISKYTSDGDFKWYFPKNQTEKIDYRITNLHVISKTDVAIFTENYIYYVKEQDDLHYYYKSKVPLGCKYGAGVMTSYDGKYVIFPSNRGLVALSYQQLVSSDEQTLSYLSDPVTSTYNTLYSQGAIKLYKKLFWIYLYCNGYNKCLILDIRNNSWWKLCYPYDILSIVDINDKTHVTIDITETSCLCKLEESYSDYYDDVNYKHNIGWYFESQKLHMGYPNHAKHISNITLTSVLDGKNEMHMDMTVRNYRKKVHTSDVEAFKFNIDSVRIYVKRLNYFNVNEFQYRITSDFYDDEEEDFYNLLDKIPLSLSSISIKYKIAGQVR